MESNISMEIPGCMKQHLMLFTPNCSVTCREYLCDCVSCLQLKFDECFKEQDAADVGFPEDFEWFQDDECNEDIDENQQIFDFINVPLFVPLFTGNPAEPLYFVKVTEKRTEIKDMKDPYGHFIHTDELFFKGNYLKFTRSRSLNNKKFQILRTCGLFPPTTHIILT